MVTDDDGCDGEANDGGQGDGGAHGDEEWDQNVGGCTDGEAIGGGKGGDCNDGDDGGDSDDSGEGDQDSVYEDSDVTMRIVMMTMLMVAAKGIKMIVTVMMVTDEEAL
nr:eggshell protein-like [Penaeus vannamei]